MLLGRGVAVVEAIRTRNASADPSRFVIEPEDHINGRRAARARGLDVVGFYHSHPRSPALPSETDRSEAGYPDHLYLIVSLAVDPYEARLYSLTGGTFLPVSFVTLP